MCKIVSSDNAFLIIILPKFQKSSYETLINYDGRRQELLRGAKLPQRIATVRYRHDDKSWMNNYQLYTISNPMVILLIS